jgi:hypothetical protein
MVWNQLTDGACYGLIDVDAHTFCGGVLAPLPM